MPMANDALENVGRGPIEGALPLAFEEQRGHRGVVEFEHRLAEGANELAVGNHRFELSAHPFVPVHGDPDHRIGLVVHNALQPLFAAKAKIQRRGARAVAAGQQEGQVHREHEAPRCRQTGQPEAGVDRRADEIPGYRRIGGVSVPLIPQLGLNHEGVSSQTFIKRTAAAAEEHLGIRHREQADPGGGFDVQVLGAWSMQRLVAIERLQPDLHQSMRMAEAEEITSVEQLVAIALPELQRRQAPRMVGGEGAVLGLKDEVEIPVKA
jgi:hypothetical protein